MTVTTTQPRPHGATLEEVAKVAGVSRATVSRVVNGNPKVTPVVRQAVERAVGRMGYVPNPAARSLVTRRSGFIALVIPEQTTSLFGDPFFPRLLVGISSELAASNVQLVLMIAQGSAQNRAEAYVAAGHVDGALLAAASGSRETRSLRRAMRSCSRSNPPLDGVKPGKKKCRVSGSVGCREGRP